MTRILLAILAATMFAGASFAVQNPLRDRLLRNERADQITGWYQRADTGEFFLFDRSGEVALLRERDNPASEVLVLFPNRAPGGGTSYKTDTGREVLRTTSLGGTTYFPLDAPNGVIVDFASAAGTITPPPRSPEEVRVLAERLAEELAFALNRNIQIEYSPAPRAELGLQHDALHMVSLAVASLQGDRRRLRDLQAISLVMGETPGASREENRLTVVITPAWGYAGRPSSALIADVLLGTD